MDPDFYYTIARPAVAEFKDRGSKFIAYAYAVNDVGAFRQRLNELKKEHPKATHHCFAYRIGMDGNNFRVSDDGEPSGTAGRPILGQIDSKGVINTAVIVVRYFGGTLLGVPGLINAYKSAAALALQLTPVIQQAVEKEFLLEFDYTQLNEVMLIVKQCGCRIIEQDNQLFCKIKLAVPKNRKEEVLYRLGQLRNIRSAPVG